ncbi:hypothetical protein MMPV_005380 [Pyropia vietnamensis]
MAEFADARSAVADVAGAAVAILLVLFCGLSEDEDIPGGEPLKGGWWATWGMSPPRMAATADAAAVSGETAPPADWSIDPESDDPFHAGLSPQWSRIGRTVPAGREEATATADAAAAFHAKHL